MAWADLLASPAEGVTLAEAVASEDAASAADTVHVTVPSFHLEQLWGPAPWSPRVDDDGSVMLIQKGDRCIIALAETAEPGQPEIWILEWWPYD